MLFDYAGFFFVPLSSRLVNDDSASCRKLTALVIKSLLGKVLTRSENNVRRVCQCSSKIRIDLLAERLSNQAFISRINEFLSNMLFFENLM